MGNIFSDNGPNLNEDSFIKLENKIGLKLPQELINFYTKTNGGIPEFDCWEGNGEYEPVVISSFLYMLHSDNDTLSIEKAYLHGVKKGYLPIDFIPFSTDWGGNYICIDLKGNIYFYATDSWHDDINLEKNIENNKRYLCSSLSQFISELISEDDAY